MDEKDRNLAFLSSGVVRYLFWLGKPAIVKDDEIKTIKNWLEGSNSEDISVEPLWRNCLDNIVLSIEINAWHKVVYNGYLALEHAKQTLVL